MNREMKITSLVILSIFFLTSLYYIPVKATVDYINIGTAPGVLSACDDIGQHYGFTHSSGKYISVMNIGTQIVLQIVGPLGTVQSLQYLESSVTPSYTSSKTVSACELDNDEILIIAVFGYNGSPYYVYATYFRVNINNYIITKGNLNSCTTNVAANGDEYRLSNIINDNGTFYCLLQGYLVGAGNINVISMLKFVASTNTFSYTLRENTYCTGDSSTIMQPYLYDEMTFDNHYYALLCWGTSTTPQVVDIDVSGNTITKVANFPNANRMTINKYLYFISSGSVYEVSGADTYYYLYVVYSTSKVVAGTPINYLTYSRMKFNNSITSATLLSNTELSISLSLAGSTSNPYWGIGFLTNDLESVYYYYPTVYSGAYHSMFAVATLSDFYDMDTSTFTMGTPIMNDEIYQQAPTDLIIKESSSQFQGAIHLGPDDFRLYFGLSFIIDDFSMTTSYTPNETPLKTKTTYTFTYEIKNNAILYPNAIVIVYVDNTLIKATTSNLNGISTVSILFNSAGNHTITVKVFKDMINTYVSLEQSTFYIVTDGVVDTSDEGITLGTITSTVNWIITYLPVTVCVFSPAIAFYKYGKTIGFFAGLCLGTFIAVSATLLPEYVLYIMALLTAIVFIMALRSGGNGG